MSPLLTVVRRAFECGNDIRLSVLLFSLSYNARCVACGVCGRFHGHHITCALVVPNKELVMLLMLFIVETLLDTLSSM